MNTSLETEVTHIVKVFEKQNSNFLAAQRPTLKSRLQKINRIHTFLSEPRNIEKLKSALRTDLRKPEVEILTSEVGILLNSIKDIKRNLRSWMADKSVATPIAILGARSYVHYEPKGVALIISPWNYPFQLCINPLLYAIAAGCPAILKPSEYSVATSSFIAEMIAELFDPEEVTVCQGGIDTATALLDLPFSHIYFTGSPTVGKIIMSAASRHLASVTLELGGKSPCFVDHNINIQKTAKKIVWGKFFNAGQTCIAPDYVLVSNQVKESLLKAIATEITKMYNPEKKGIQSSPDLARIINKKHFTKVTELIEDAVHRGAKVISGGQADVTDLYIAPTVLTHVDEDAKILKEEIFGPVLPVIGYDNLADALDIVRNNPNPLALYIMSNSSKYVKTVINQTTAGGTVVNDFLLHFANHHLPFGGVNNSGMGKSHGRHGFIAFTNERAVIKNSFAMTALMHPPFTNLSRKIARLVGKWI